MNRVALLACLVLAGCPKASAPTPPVAIKTNLSDVKPGETITATKRPPLELRGDVPGQMTFQQFEEKYAGKVLKELPVPGSIPGQKTISIEEADDKSPTFADREADIAYRFYDGVLESIMIGTSTPSTAQAFADALTEKFGRPDRNGIDETVMVWEDDKLRMSAQNIGVSLSSVEVRAKREAAAKTRAQGDL